MPVISLFNQPAVADAWHEVTAPGGYEWWYFDAEDAGGELRMVAIFFQGFVFHPGYLRAYGKYHHRPTRNAPPLPAEFPCAYFVLYRDEKIIAQFMSQVPADQFTASVDQVSVSVGPNHLRSMPDGSLELDLQGVPWVLTGQGPKFLETQKLLGTFRFHPRVAHAPMERRFFSRDWSGADHHWIVANPLCSVTGKIEVVDSSDQQRTALVFNGSGYHDHNFGTGPIGPGLRRWMWGRVLMPDHVLMFHFAQPNDSTFAEEVHLLEADEMGFRELPVDRFHADWSGKTSTALRYPSWVEAGPLRLVHPKVVDASPFYLRVAYEASVRGTIATAFCEIAYPHRLRWPVLGRMIEMSIRKEKGPAAILPKSIRV